MVSTFLFACLGLAILVVAGDYLVKGAVNLSLRLGVPALIVSLTVVAFGTSAPELLIAVDSVLKDAPGIALGNVVGSNTANILLVLGVPALIYGLDTRRSRVKKSFSTMIAATLVFIALAFTGQFSTWHALILLAGLALILIDQFREGRRQRINTDELEGADPDLAGWKIGALLAAGMVGLPLGANILVTNAKEIALAVGISDVVIGLTLVAIGTSLPELATTLAAGAKRQADVAIGNALGSNIWNLFAIIGVAGLVGDIPVSASFLRMDLWVMLGASLVMLPFVFTQMTMTRWVGVIFCLMYGLYIWAIVV